MPANRMTLGRFLIEERRRHPTASGALNSLLLDVALACKAVAGRVGYGALDAMASVEVATNVHGEQQQKLDVLANDIFLLTTQWGGALGAVASEELPEPHQIPAGYPRGRYLLVVDPLDGSSNIDVNVSVGSIFSILRAPDAAGPDGPNSTDGGDMPESAFLQPGVQQVAAGYAIYGPSTMLVLTVGTGVYGFTLDPRLGEFILTRPSIRVPRTTSEFAINASNRRFWSPAVRRYVDECLAGRTGPRGRDFNMRWVASLVAETHRILTRGGVFLYPRDSKQPTRPGRLRLLYEANPVAMIIEQAGGRASTGWQRMLEVEPTALHQRIPLIFGAAEEIELIERYHAEEPGDGPELFETPLYATRGLFRTPA